VNGTSYEAPNYAAFSNLLLVHPSSVQPFFSAQFSNTFSLSSSLNARDLVSHRTKLQAKILVFTFLDSRREDKWFWNEW
jgi:hypothetical protein